MVFFIHDLSRESLALFDNVFIMYYYRGMVTILVENCFSVSTSIVYNAFMIVNTDMNINRRVTQLIIRCHS